MAKKTKKKVQLKSKKCIFCRDVDCPDLVKNVEMVLDHKEVEDLITYYCAKCGYIGSVELKYNEEIWDRKELLLEYIQNIKDKIKFEQDEIEHRKKTMVHFKYPEKRIKGIDIIKYELDIPILKEQLRFLKQIYYDNYGEEI